jgi:hypothetical protein
MQHLSREEPRCLLGSPRWRIRCTRKAIFRGQVWNYNCIYSQIILSHPPTAPQNQWTFIRIEGSGGSMNKIRNREEEQLTDIEAPKVIEPKATEPKTPDETSADTAEDRRKPNLPRRRKGRGGKQTALERDKAEQDTREDTAALRALEAERREPEEKTRLAGEQHQAELMAEELQERLAEERREAEKRRKVEAEIRRIEIERKRKRDEAVLRALEEERRKAEEKNRLAEEQRYAELKAKELEERLAEERRQAEERRKAEAETRRIEIERKRREDEAALRALELEAERREAEEKNQLAEEQRQAELKAKQLEESLAEERRQAEMELKWKEAALGALEEKAEEKQPLAEEQCQAELAVRSQDDAQQREMHVRLATIVKDRGGDDYRKLLALRGDDAQAMLNHLQAVCFLLHSFMTVTHCVHPRLWIPSKLTILRKVR